MTQPTRRFKKKKPGPVAHCHFLIKETAVAMAHELYDTMMTDNLWYEAWKKRYPNLKGKKLEERFVANNWGRLVPQARATLASMLRGPLDEKAKEDILDALVKDSTLIRGRANPPIQL